MLVLTRKKEESVIIGNDIRIKILKTGKNTVELGITAPKNFSIFREEVFEEIRRQNIQSAKSLQNKNINNIRSIIKATQKPKKKK
jgi:carbon storage regulator